jgi:hypothetical protein
MPAKTFLRFVIFINAWRRILWITANLWLRSCERKHALTGAKMNQEVIVGLIMVLAVGFILAKLVGETSPSDPSASEDD